MSVRGRIHIGTSGWHYKHWRGTFYPADLPVKQHFAYYARHFDTVEINNSFYKLPPPSVFEDWYARSPENFLFVIKANRFITHNLKLTRPSGPLNRLFDSILPLREKLGPVLLQLPPGWKVNAGRLRDFLEALPAGFRYVFEFRNETWYDASVYDLLRQHDCAFCMYDLGGHQSPMVETAGFLYIRLHGPSQTKYHGSYPDAALRKWAKRCREWQKQGKDVFVYFDNDQLGYAAFDALRLRELTD